MIACNATLGKVNERGLGSVSGAGLKLRWSYLIVVETLKVLLRTDLRGGVSLWEGSLPRPPSCSMAHAIAMTALNEPPTPAPVGSLPLTPDQQQQLAEARRRGQKIRRAASVAAFNGWSIAIFALLSAPFALFSLAGFFLAAGMAVVAYGEFAGRRRLLRFEPEAATRLGWNQLALLGLIVSYSLWMTAAGLTGVGPFSAEFAAQPELQEVLGSAEAFDKTYRLVLVGFYAIVIALSVAFQGGNAWYYFSRCRYVEAYINETPDWILDVQRLTHGA